MAGRWLPRSVVAVLVCLFLFCLLSPFLMLYSYDSETEKEQSGPGLVTSRKALDISDDDRTLKDRYNDLKFQIEELQRIKVSVRNEMRELEKQRYSILQDTESYKSSLYQLQGGIHQSKRELGFMQASLAKVGHELYAATPPPCYSSKPPPIYVLPGDNKALPSLSDEGHKSYSVSKIDQVSDCETDISYCVDMTSCPLGQNLKFFVYSYLPPFPKLKYPELLQNILKHLEETNSLTKDPKEACLFIVLLGPFDELSLSESPIGIEDIIYSLKYWGKEGKNHVLINLSDLKDMDDVLDEFDPQKAFVAQSKSSHYWRRGFDVMVPLVDNVLTPDLLWKQLPPLVPAQRKYLLHFKGEMNGKDDIISDTLRKLTNQIVELADVILTCSKTGTSNTKGMIPLCGSQKERLDSLIQSTFAIVPMTGKTGLIRLNEALLAGAVPVIIGTSPLPFGSVIDWKEAAIFLPMGRLNELHLILRSISNDRILELRWQGRFLWETYFSSLSKVLMNVVSVLRYRLSHPPPVTDGIEGRWKRFGAKLKITSPQFQHNSSIYNYRFWNVPPGPTLLYPHTPWDPNPISGSTYANMTDAELASLPPNIVQAAGITGPFFQNYLLGDRPDEYFTVVMLTYKREEVVVESIQRFNDLKFLAKVIIVWNDVEKRPYNIEWPSLSVPLEVIWADENSLNNRFLPYNSIQTEAILSIDDDIYLRHDEIQFAFRVWRESRDRLVGFPGRFHAFDVHNRKWLYNSNYTCQLSMVLTGAAFFHKYYAYLYSFWQPQAVLDLVDSKINCEDIAMNFLISHITRKPPLKVTSRWTFHCPNCPDTLSQSDAHFSERHECINILTQIYGYMPLLYTQFRLDSVLFKTRLPSHLDKCYQYV